MKTRIPPPLLLVIAGTVMWFIAKSEYAWSISIPHAWVPALVLLAVGVSFSVTALRQFRKAETTVNPMRPEEATALVDSGIFARSRNPMYVGLLIDLTAWGVWLQSLANILVLVVFVVLLNELQIKPEEAALKKLFGEAYNNYCRRVRRWL